MTTKKALILAINNIEVIYDHVILVLKGVSLEVHEKGIVALLGANGPVNLPPLKRSLICWAPSAEELQKARLNLKVKT